MDITKENGGGGCADCFFLRSEERVPRGWLGESRRLSREGRGL